MRRFDELLPVFIRLRHRLLITGHQACVSQWSLLLVELFLFYEAVLFLRLVSGVNLANYDGDRNPNQPIQAEENIILKAGSKCGESD